MSCLFVQLQRMLRSMMHVYEILNTHNLLIVENFQTIKRKLKHKLIFGRKIQNCEEVLEAKLA